VDVDQVGAGDVVQLGGGLAWAADDGFVLPDEVEAPEGDSEGDQVAGEEALAGENNVVDGLGVDGAQDVERGGLESDFEFGRDRVHQQREHHPLGDHEHVVDVRVVSGVGGLEVGEQESEGEGVHHVRDPTNGSHWKSLSIDKPQHLEEEQHDYGSPEGEALPVSHPVGKGVLLAVLNHQRSEPHCDQELHPQQEVHFS